MTVWKHLKKLKFKLKKFHVRLFHANAYEKCPICKLSFSINEIIICSAVNCIEMVFVLHLKCLITRYQYNFFNHRNFKSVA